MLITRAPACGRDVAPSRRHSGAIPVASETIPLSPFAEEALEQENPLGLRRVRALDVGEVDRATL